MSSNVMQVPRGRGGDWESVCTVPKWEGQLKAALRRERTLQQFKEQKVLLAEAEYGRLDEKTLHGRRAPECFLGDRKAFLLSGRRCTVWNLRLAKAM